MNILFITLYIPFPYQHNGNTTRVYHLSKYMSQHNNCYIYTDEYDGKRISGLLQSNIFTKIFYLDKLGTMVNNKYINTARRHIARFRRQYYIYYIVYKYNIDVIINYIDDSTLVNKSCLNVYDITDCKVLTAKRKYAINKSIYLGSILQSQESIISRNDLSLFISEKDKHSCINNLKPMFHKRVVVVPNGVASPFFKAAKESVNCLSEEQKAFAFWGKLNYNPNEDAIMWFYKEVYLRWFEKTEYVWHIIGIGNSELCKDISARHKNIVNAGYVADLKKYLDNINIMINPIRLGAGVKNKILEAMALKKMIISTEIGASGIVNFQKDINYLCPETPLQWYEYIIDATINHDKYNIIKEENWQNIQANYEWENISKQAIQHIVKAKKEKAINKTNIRRK